MIPLIYALIALGVLAGTSSKKDSPWWTRLVAAIAWPLMAGAVLGNYLVTTKPGDAGI